MVQSGTIPGIGDDEIWEDGEAMRLRNRNKWRTFESEDYTFNRMYFDQDAIYNEEDFERRFRIPCVVF